MPVSEILEDGMDALHNTVDSAMDSLHNGVTSFMDGFRNLLVGEDPKPNDKADQHENDCNCKH